MKIPLMYGTVLGIINALCTFGLFFTGFHSSPDKIAIAQWISTVVGIVSSVVCYALAMRDQRAARPVDQEWTYGSAAGAGIVTALVGVVIGTIVAYIYFAYVNPQFQEIALQHEVTKLEAKGIPADRIEAGMGIMRKFTNPAVMVIVQLILGGIFGTILALITAIFFKSRVVRVEEVDAPPPPVAGV